MGFGKTFVRNLFFGVDETPAPFAMVPVPDEKLQAQVSSWDSDKQPLTWFHESVRMSGIDGAISTLHSAGECIECQPHALLRFFKVDW